MNLPVHSGPAECRLEGLKWGCPCTEINTIQYSEQFQQSWKIFQLNPHFFSKQTTSTGKTDKNPFLTFSRIKSLQPAEGQGLPGKSPCRKVLAVLPAYVRSFAPSALPPLTTIKDNPNIKEYKSPKPLPEVDDIPMQMSIHYSDEDQYLVDKLEEEANRKRKSKSAMVLSILEEHFEAERKLGEILKDMRLIDVKQLQRALEAQRKTERQKKLGQIMLEEDYVSEEDLGRALQVQRK